MGAVICRQVTAAYNGNRVLHGVDLEVRPGEWLAVIGPNGSGKSTLLRAIAGTLPSGGTITVDGDRLSTLSRRQVARRVAVVPQNPVVPAGMSVLDYVLLGRNPYVGTWSFESAEDVEVARRAVAGLDLVGMENRSLAALSGGERQRAVLARAVAQEAAIMLLDEPTTALDVGHQQQVLELVDRLRRHSSMAVLSAMHDLTLAGQYADRLMLLVGGRVVATGSARQVLSEGNVAEHYRARVAVLTGPDDQPVIVPRRAARPEGGNGASDPFTSRPILPMVGKPSERAGSEVRKQARSPE